MTDISTLDTYKEHWEQFRGMNAILYQIPPIMTAVIGGLWYFAATNTDRIISRSVFLFAAVACLAFANVMQRFRLAFNAYLNNLNQLDGYLAISVDDPFPSTITTIQLLLLVATLFSAGGFVHAL